MRSSNAMKCVSIESCTASLTDPFQGCKDVEDKLGELVLWLIKLKDNVTTTGANGNPQEAKGRDQLTRFVSHPYRFIDSSQWSVPGP